MKLVALLATVVMSSVSFAGEYGCKVTSKVGAEAPTELDSFSLTEAASAHVAPIAGTDLVQLCLMKESLLLCGIAHKDNLKNNLASALEFESEVVEPFSIGATAVGSTLLHVSVHNKVHYSTVCLTK